VFVLSFREGFEYSATTQILLACLPRDVAVVTSKCGAPIDVCDPKHSMCPTLHLRRKTPGSGVFRHNYLVGIRDRVLWLCSAGTTREPHFALLRCLPLGPAGP
jgi:hypothetical protein